jgi:hypothetical protein
VSLLRFSSLATRCPVLTSRPSSSCDAGFTTKAKVSPPARSEKELRGRRGFALSIRIELPLKESKACSVRGRGACGSLRRLRIGFSPLMATFHPS